MNPVGDLAQEGDKDQTSVGSGGQSPVGPDAGSKNQCNEQNNPNKAGPTQFSKGPDVLGMGVAHNSAIGRYKGELGGILKGSVLKLIGIQTPTDVGPVLPHAQGRGPAV